MKKIQLRPLRTIAVNDGIVRSVAFSPSGDLFVAGGERFVHLFETRSGRRLHKLGGHTKAIHDVTFSVDGSMLASASADTTIRLWDPTTGKLQRRLRVTHGPRSASPIFGVAFHPRAHSNQREESWMLASCGPSSNLVLWDTETGEWESIVETKHGGGLKCIAVSSDGKSLAVAGAQDEARIAGQVGLYRIRRGLQPIAQPAHEGKSMATHVAHAPLGNTVLSCAGDNVIRLWNSQTGDPVASIPGTTKKTSVTMAHFLDDGHIASVTTDERVQLWSVKDGQLVSEVCGTESHVHGFSVSASRKLLATCGSKGKVTLWKLSPVVENVESPGKDP